ncbi:MAG: type I-U CRISPR-associated RAMP protein Csb1/Cas7u [Methanomassiliicoccales archaeon]
MKELETANRLLMKARLKPLQGDRFQPTGFPDLGPAEYVAPDGTAMLLVESAQSMANRMEAVCWDDGKNDIIPELKGLPYIMVKLKDGATTTSIQEAHRINSEYILGKKGDPTFVELFKKEAGVNDSTPIEWKKIYATIFKYDPNSLVHGAFLEEVDGRIRFPRALSAFIEAADVKPVQSGGVKFSRVAMKEKQGEGNVPYTRIEYVARDITAYFNVDLSAIRSMGLGKNAENLIIALSLFKIRKFLEKGLRLRTACDLQLIGDLEISPSSFRFPSSKELSDELPKLIESCSNMFPEPRVTQISAKA